MYGWDSLVLLQHLLDDGLSKTAIAQRLGVSRFVASPLVRTYLHMCSRRAGWICTCDCEYLSLAKRDTVYPSILTNADNIRSVCLEHHSGWCEIR